MTCASCGCTPPSVAPMSCPCVRGCHDAYRFVYGVPFPVPPWPLTLESDRRQPVDRRPPPLPTEIE